MFQLNWDWLELMIRHFRFRINLLLCDYHIEPSLWLKFLKWKAHNLLSGSIFFWTPNWTNICCVTFLSVLPSQADVLHRCDNRASAWPLVLVKVAMIFDIESEWILDRSLKTWRWNQVIFIFIFGWENRNFVTRRNGHVNLNYSLKLWLWWNIFCPYCKI